MRFKWPQEDFTVLPTLFLNASPVKNSFFVFFHDFFFEKRSFSVLSVPIAGTENHGGLLLLLPCKTRNLVKKSDARDGRCYTEGEGNDRVVVAVQNEKW